MRGAQAADEDERRRHVAELDLEHLDGVDLVDALGPAVVVDVVGHEPAGVDRGRAGGERERGHRVQIVRGAELQHVRRVRERFGLAGDQQRVGVGRAAHGLRGVVDQDVERTVGRDRVGELDDLPGLAQVDADDVQAVEPVAAVGHRREAARRVLREAGRDRRVRAVAQQPQRDVHADLRAPAREQRAPPGEVGAGLAPLPVERRAGRDRAGGRSRRPRCTCACTCNTAARG